MLKLEKIIILFKLIYLKKRINLMVEKRVFCSKKRVKISSFFINYSIILKAKFKKINWFIYNFNHYKKIKKCKFLYLCIKKEKFSSVISIYYKNILLLNITRLKKTLKNRRKLEKFKLKLENSKIRRKKKFDKKRRIFLKKRSNKLKGLFKWLFRIILKVIFKFNINIVKVCVFKSKNLKFKFLKKFSTIKNLKFRKNFFKLIRNLSLVLKLNKINNLKFVYLKSNNFSHSKKFLKIKRKRA